MLEGGPGPNSLKTAGPEPLTPGAPLKIFPSLGPAITFFLF